MRRCIVWRVDVFCIVIVIYTHLQLVALKVGLEPMKDFT